MKIQITRGTVVDGAVVLVGDILCLDDQQARYLIAIGKAQEYVEPAPLEVDKAQIYEDPTSTVEKAVKSAPEKRVK